MMKDIKPFLVCEWIAILGAVTIGFYQWDISLWMPRHSFTSCDAYFSIKLKKEYEGGIEK
jgi:hypothetical protein